MLLKCKNIAKKPDYADLAIHSLKVFGKNKNIKYILIIGEFSVKLAIMLNSLGVCTAYIAVFGDSIDKIYERADGMDYSHNFFYPRRLFFKLLI